MACCLTAPSHYLNQCWLITSKVYWHSSRAIPQQIPQPSVNKISLKITYSKFHSYLPRGQWVNSAWTGLILDMQGSNYYDLTCSVLWLLMPWVLVSPCHSHPWYWLCKIGRSLSYTKKESSTSTTTCVMSVWRNDINCKYMFKFPPKNLACKGLIFHTLLVFFFPFQLFWSLMTVRVNVNAWWRHLPSNPVYQWVHTPSHGRGMN